MTLLFVTYELCGTDGKASKCVLEVEKIKRRRQQRRAAHVAAREHQPDAGCITDTSQLGYGYDVMIASVVMQLCTVRQGQIVVSENVHYSGIAYILIHLYVP